MAVSAQDTAILSPYLESTHHFRLKSMQIQTSRGHAKNHARGLTAISNLVPRVNCGVSRWGNGGGAVILSISRHLPPSSERKGVLLGYISPLYIPLVGLSTMVITAQSGLPIKCASVYVEAQTGMKV